MNSKELIARFVKEGWDLRGLKGSHHIYIHPKQGGHISVPHPKLEISLPTLRRYVSAEKIKPVKVIGSSLLFSAKDLRQLKQKMA
jgi:predicted RNA binding protein YcfA (HicA-like mRNA interferase family)